MPAANFLKHTHSQASDCDKTQSDRRHNAVKRLQVVLSLQYKLLLSKVRIKPIRLHIIYRSSYLLNMYNDYLGAEQMI